MHRFRKGMNMKPFLKPQILHSLLLFNIILLGSSSISSIPQQNYANYCENTTKQTPFLNPNSSILNSIVLCISQNLYFRTSLGLFHVSSLDNNGRFLTITHSSCSSLQYVSPMAVTAGFPSPPEPNSLLLFNCSSRRTHPILPTMQNCGNLYTCGGAEENNNYPHPCLVVEDLRKFDRDFHPRHLNCSHFSWVHRRTPHGGHDHGFKVGTRISVDIPRVPEICQGCEKPNGTCGAGLNCLCHPKECSK